MGVVVILLLNVMEVFSVGGGALLDRLCMVFQIMSISAAHPPSLRCPPRHQINPLVLRWPRAQLQNRFKSVC